MLKPRLVYIDVDKWDELAKINPHAPISVLVREAIDMYIDSNREK